MNKFQRKSKYILSAFVLLSSVCILIFVFGKGEERTQMRPMLLIEDATYIDPYLPLSKLPFNYYLAGKLSEEQANGTGLTGCEYYVNKFDKNGMYVYQKEEQDLWVYKRWIKVDEKKLAQRRLTLEDVIQLAKKGDALSEKDFEHYSYFEPGSRGMRVYEIDKNFSLWIVGADWRSEPGALRIYLRGRGEGEWKDLIDVRTENVEEFLSRESLQSEKEFAFFPYPDREGEIYNCTNIGDYWYKSANFSFRDDGTGGFYLSPISSYMGIGTYEIVGDHLNLRTNDGWYAVCFDIVGDTLVFDKEASNIGAKWEFPMLENGVVLE